MPQTFTAAAMGNAANDGSGNGIRTGGLKIAADLTELYSNIATMQGQIVAAVDILRAGTGVGTGASNERIDYSSQFTVDCQISIIDAIGVGVQVISQDADGFNYDSLSAGNFGWTALINV